MWMCIKASTENDTVSYISTVWFYEESTFKVAVIVTG